VDKHGLSHYFTLEESTWNSFFFFGLPNPADYSFLPEEKEGGGELESFVPIQSINKDRGNLSKKGFFFLKS
jgi:hypothetical protein